MAGHAPGTGLRPRRKMSVHLAHIKRVDPWGKLVLNK